MFLQDSGGKKYGEQQASGQIGSRQMREGSAIVAITMYKKKERERETNRKPHQGTKRDCTRQQMRNRKKKIEKERKREKD